MNQVRLSDFFTILRSLKVEWYGTNKELHFFKLVSTNYLSCHVITLNERNYCSVNFNKNGYYGKQRPKTSLRQQLYLSIEATFEPEIFVACFTHVDL